MRPEIYDYLVSIKRYGSSCSSSSRRIFCAVTTSQLSAPDQAFASMPDEEPEVGDTVAWNWGSSHIEGEVVEKSDKDITKQIKGKTITKHGEESNPAYFVKQTQKKGICPGQCHSC